MLVGALILIALLLFLVTVLGRGGGGSGQLPGQKTEKGGGLFGFLNRSSATATPGVAQLSSNDVSRKVLDWLQKQKNQSGVYFGQVVCNGSQCQQPVESNQSGVEPMWSRYINYKKNHQASDLQILTSDINVYSDRKIVARLQNRFWDCKLMYEMWKDSMFTEDQKNKIKSICYDNQPFPPPDNAPDTASVDFSKITQGQTISSDLNVTSDNLTDFAVMASDFATRYMWDNNQGNLKVAQEYFKYAVVAYTKLTAPDTATPLLGIAAFDIYKASNDKQYLDFANYIFDKVAAQQCDSIEECTYMISFAKFLNALSPQQKYNDYMTSSKDILMSQGFDYSGYGAYKNGFGAFHAFGQGNQVIYPVQLNALISGLLVD